MSIFRQRIFAFSLVLFFFFFFLIFISATSSRLMPSNDRGSRCRFSRPLKYVFSFSHDISHKQLIANQTCFSVYTDTPLIQRHSLTRGRDGISFDHSRFTCHDLTAFVGFDNLFRSFFFFFFIFAHRQDVARATN